MRPMTSVIALLAMLPALANADEIFLKSGGRLSGQIVKKTATSMEIDVGAGRVTVPVDHVLRIEEGRSALMEYQDRAHALKPGDVEGWRALGDWAAGKGLGTQSREAYERALHGAPADPGLNAALGRTQVNGQWLNEEDAYRAKGYVKFEGSWMTPEEHAATLADRQAYDNAERARQAEDRANRAEADARDAREKQQKAEADAAAAQSEGIPLWYGWAPGPTAWPSTVVVPPRAATRPAGVRR